MQEKRIKEPTSNQTLQVFLNGLCCLSFGLWLIWIPIVGIPLMLIGVVMLLLTILTLILKVIK